MSAEDAIKDIVSGSLGGVAQVACGHPLDTMKVRLQSQSVPPGHPQHFKGMKDCFFWTVRNEGVSALYKGAAAPLSLAIFWNASTFFVYGQADTYLRSRPDRAGGSLTRLTPGESAIAGAITGVSSSFIDAPMDFTKSQMQKQLGKGKFTSVFHCGRTVLDTHGIRGLYTGLSATLLRNIPQLALYFWAFNTAEETLARWATAAGQPAEPSALSSFLAGGFAGGMCWNPLIAPLDFVKTRIQTDSLEPGKKRYTGIIQAFSHTLKHEGPSAFFRGYIPCIVRAVPVNATIFLAVKTSKRALTEAHGPVTVTSERS